MIVRATEVIFEWRIHPLRDDPRRAVLFLIALSVTLTAVWWSFRSAGWAALAALLVGGSLHRFWLVTEYRMSEDELEYRRLFVRMTRRLSDFKRVDFEAHGAFLSPFATPDRLEHYRGLYVPYPPDPEPFRAFLKRRIEGIGNDG
jgi:hypothetical protein